jgi:pimeloyl-ACP methyl ester carboxylesterase
VRRLALIDIPPSSPRTDADIPGFPDDFATLADAVAAQRAAAPRASEALAALYAGMGTRPEPGGRLRRDHDPYFLRRWPFRDDDRWEELAAMTQPLLVVVAGDSPILAGETAEAMVARARRARLVEIPDSGHLIPLEQPAALAAALRDFLGSQP